MSLDGKVALVTGGGSGIGFGIASVLASRGVSLVLAQRRIDRVEAAASALKPTPVLPLQVDIRHADSVERMVESAMARFGRIDILVNNASVTRFRQSPACSTAHPNGPTTSSTST